MVDESGWDNALQWMLLTHVCVFWKNSGCTCTFFWNAVIILQYFFTEWIELYWSLKAWSRYTHA